MLLRYNRPPGRIELLGGPTLVDGHATGVTGRSSRLLSARVQE